MRKVSTDFSANFGRFITGRNLLPIINICNIFRIKEILAIKI